VRRERMAKRVTARPLGQSGPSHGFLDRPLQDGLVQVMAAPLARGPIDVVPGRWRRGRPGAVGDPPLTAL
jgi:hypothetical protein